MTEPEHRDDRVNILLVDDRPANLFALHAVLERPDYNLIEAYSGEQALNLILRHDFAVILMDVAMPGMDGFEVASIIKEREKYRTIPIIFVTASIQNIEWIFKAYSMGAVDFLSKPMDPHAVRAKVSVFVELYRQKMQLKRHAERLQEVERRERELEVSRLRSESDRRYRHLAESIPHIVWTADASGAIDYFNHRWLEMTGCKLDESLASGWWGAVHQEDAARASEEWAAAIQAGQPFHLELRLNRTDGTHHWFLDRALPEKDGTGRVLRWVGTLTDVDEEKRAHEELQAAIGLRDEFMSVASHELRTPLSALQLQLQSLHRLLERVQNESADERVGKKMTAALQQTERLARLIDNLLDVSRITRGKLELQLEEFDLADAVRDVVERFRDEAARVRSEIVLKLESVPGRWDRLRVEQVITNLLSNSIKYAPGTPIELTVKPDEECALLSVLDHGIGIDPDSKLRIFERFERGVPSRHYGGLGLGLYIVKQIVDAHGGLVHVESGPGAGSEFIVTLPLRRDLSLAQAPALETEASHADAQ